MLKVINQEWQTPTFHSDHISSKSPSVDEWKMMTKVRYQMSKSIDVRLHRRLHWPKDHFVKRSLCLLQGQSNSDSIVPSEEETEKEIEDNEDLNQSKRPIKPAQGARDHFSRSILILNQNLVILTDEKEQKISKLQRKESKFQWEPPWYIVKVQLPTITSYQVSSIFDRKRCG